MNDKLVDLLYMRIKNEEMELSQAPEPLQEKIKEKLEEANNDG